MNNLYIFKTAKRDDLTSKQLWFGCGDQHYRVSVTWEFKIDLNIDAAFPSNSRRPPHHCD